MLPQEVIRRKRDGEALEADEIAGFIAGVGDGSIGDAQIAAFAMAVRLKGMTPAETVAMTLAMRDSGTVLSWPGAERPVADKHSTGGVGDNVSLMLAPIAAACGLTVPMISGRASATPAARSTSCNPFPVTTSRRTRKPCGTAWKRPEPPLSARRRHSHPPIAASTPCATSPPPSTACR